MERPAIVFDLDGTILERNFIQSLSLYLFPFGSTGKIFPGVIDVMKRIVVKADIFALTARCKIARNKTKAWVNSYGLPFKEIIHSPFFLLTEPQRIRFKKKVLKDLKNKGIKIVIGVGDRASDLDSYIQEGIFPVMISSFPQSSKYKKLIKRIQELGLKEKEDFMLFMQENENDLRFWDRAGEWIFEKLRDITKT